MHYNDAFRAAGMLGKGQLSGIFMAFVMNFYCGWQSVIPVFVGADVSFKCADNCTDSLDWVYEESDDSFDNKCVEGCQKYVYDNSPGSIISEYDLACGGNKVLATISNSAFWVGFLISCFVAGYAGDRFGRRPINLAVMLFYFIFSTASVFSFDIWFYTIMRFFCGFCHGGFIAMSFLLMAEVIDKRYLAEFSMGSQVLFALGEMLAPAIGYAFKNSWRYQVLTVSLAIIPIFIFAVIFVPESPLWLHSKGRYRKAQEVLRLLAKLNNRDPSIIVLGDETSQDADANDFNSSIVSNSVSEDEQISISDTQELINEVDQANSELTVSIVDLFRTGPAIMLSLGQISAWFSVSLVFFGLIFGVGEIGGSIYLNSALLSGVEIPVWFICFAMNYCGRKPTFLACLILSSLACLILPFTQPLAEGHVQIAFAMVGKCMAAGGFNILYTYSPELYPTVLRGTGLLLCSAAARVAVIIAPFVTNLSYGPYDCTPYIIFAACGFLSSVFVFFFGPETLNKPLSNTIKDFYTFAADHRNVSVPISNEVSQHDYE